jgi:hypothetical protein
MQDRRQTFHDAALAKAHGPTNVRPGVPARFENEVRYAASTTSIETMRPIEVYKAHVERDQRRLSSRLQRSIQKQARSNDLTGPKAQYAPLKDNSNGHVTENGIYVPDITGHQRKTRFDDQL